MTDRGSALTGIRSSEGRHHHKNIIARERFGCISAASRAVFLPGITHNRWMLRSSLATEGMHRAVRRSGIHAFTPCGAVKFSFASRDTVFCPVRIRKSICRARQQHAGACIVPQRRQCVEAYALLCPARRAGIHAFTPCGAACRTTESGSLIAKVIHGCPSVSAQHYSPKHPFRHVM